MRVLAVASVAKSLAHQAPCLWDELLDQGVDLTLAAEADGWEGVLPEAAEFVDVPLGRSPLRSVRASTIGGLRTLLDQSWDLIQVSTPVAGAWVRLLAPRQTPLLYLAHGFHFHEGGRFATNFVFRNVEQMLLRRTSALAVVCDEDYQQAERMAVRRSIPCARLSGGGIDIQRFAAAAASTQTAPSPRRIVFCGDLNDNKDPLLALEVAQRLHERFGSTLTLVGQGPLDAAVRTWVSGRHADWVDLLDRSDRMPELLGSTDLLLAPSRREGLPRVIIEALASGTMVAARANRGSTELLRDDLGLLFESAASPQDWADRIEASWPEHVLRADRCRERAWEYSSEVVRAEYVDLLRRMGCAPDPLPNAELPLVAGSR